MDGMEISFGILGCTTIWLMGIGFCGLIYDFSKKQLVVAFLGLVAYLALFIWFVGYNPKEAGATPMPKGKDTYEAVHQALTEVVLPQLEALRAEVQRLNDRLDARPAPTTTTSDLNKELERLPSLPPLSPQGNAYVNMIVQRITDQAEQRAAEWAREQAKDPEARIASSGLNKRTQKK